MSLLRLKTRECRVGIVGLSNAGKTVMLTSLIDHLHHHDEDRFRIGHHATLRKFQIEPVDKGWVKFNFEQYRDALVHRGRWPRKPETVPNLSAPSSGATGVITTQF